MWDLRVRYRYCAQKLLVVEGLGKKQRKTLLSIRRRLLWVTYIFWTAHSATADI